MNTTIKLYKSFHNVNSQVPVVFLYLTIICQSLSAQGKKKELSEWKSVSTCGTGFRCIVARNLGTNMGMDFAFSQDDFAFYIVFGTAWMS